MIHIFYGNDRNKIKEAAKRVLGENYEVLEGLNVQPVDMASVFLGGTLFAEKRAILITDLGENKESFDKLPNFIDTPHEVVLFESRLDKRTVVYKEIKDKVEIREFSLPDVFDSRVAFDIYKIAKKDGRKAVQMVEKIEEYADPFQMVGAFTSEALRDFSARQGSKEKRVLVELSKLDMLMKTNASIQPFSLLKSFLLQVSLLR